MRFFLTRIFKNIPFLNKYWLSLLEYFDFKYYDKHCQNYKIIPMGDYCLPRVITTINRLKPTKKYGEKSFPFDLCFSDFNSNTHFVNSHFNDFFDDVESDDKQNCYVNKKYNCVFNHDQMPIDEFKEKYTNRINNLYSAISDTSKHLFFLIASFTPIEDKQIEAFINTVNKYRPDGKYSVIIINQSDKKFEYDIKNVYCIDLSDDDNFNKMNIKGEWALDLKKMKGRYAKAFNRKIISELYEIIKKSN